MYDVSWRLFKEGFAEVLFLIKEAEKASAAPLIGAKFSPQQILLRSAVLLLASHVELFFKSIGEEFADGLPKTWASLSFTMKRYVVLQAREHLLAELSKDKYQVCGDEHSVNSVRSNIKTVSEWIESPVALSMSPHRSKLEYFYRTSAPRAIDRYLCGFHKDGMSFFSWIDKKGFDRSRFWTVLDQLVTIRTQIVHEGGGISPSLKDARLYLATSTKIIRQARLFLAE